MHLSIVLLLLYAFPAQAYVGPGAAITLLGSVLGFSSLVVLGMISSVAWPIWLVVKYMKQRKADKQRMASTNVPEDNDNP